MEACELLTVELRLDRIEAELADELPAHVRSFARAHAQRLWPPPPPDVLLRPATLATARAALVHPVLADRGLALLRLAVPAALEADPGVTAARAAEPTWSALSTLAAARDAAAAARFGRRALDVMHRVHGSAARRAPATDDDHDPPLPPAVAGWFEADGIEVDDRAIAATWEALCGRHGTAGALWFERATGVRPRAFIIEPGREVIAVIPERVATPAERFAVLHELGHAVAALALSTGIPRVVDEAAAAYIARAIERPADRWYSSLARAARERRRALAGMLDRIERRPALRPAPRISERPPWALWHDPGAQAAYLVAEQIADELDRELGPAPASGALATALAAHRAPIDRLGSASYAV